MCERAGLTHAPCGRTATDTGKRACRAKGSLKPNGNSWAAADQWYGQALRENGMTVAAKLGVTPGPRKRVPRGEAARRRRLNFLPATLNEVIADIRGVSFSAGLHSPRLLRWEDYRAFGGRFSYQQVNEVGDWASLRRAAASRAA